MALDAGAVGAKIAWLAWHEPGRVAGARWILSPRDLMAWRLTGAVATDHTLASATGLYEVDHEADSIDRDGRDGRGDGADGDHRFGPLLWPLGEVLEHVSGLGPAGGRDRFIAERLPIPVPSTTVVGNLRPGPAAELGLRAGIPVIIGAGDRACEVLGAGASSTRPMVSWGTTANVSVPTVTLEHRRSPALVTTRGAARGLGDRRRPVGGGLDPRVAGPTHRHRRGDPGGPGRGQPPGGRRRDRTAVAGWGPGAVVARRRPGRLRGAGARPRCR